MSMYIHHALVVEETKKMGKGVFTVETLAEGMIIEESPVIVMDGKQRKLLDQTRLHDYIFEWGESGQSHDNCCMALGYIAIYNHAYASNCEYEMNLAQDTIRIKTVRQVNAGEELFINYNGNWNDDKPVWFETK